MTKDVAVLRRRPPMAGIDPTLVLNAIANAILVVDGEGFIHYANAAAEQLFESGMHFLCQQALKELVPPDSPVFSLIAQARADQASVQEYGVMLDTPRTGARTMTIQVSPLPDQEDWVVISMNEHSIALKIGAH